MEGNLALCKNLFHFITCHATTLEKHQLGFIYVIVGLHLQDLKTQIWGWGVGGGEGTHFPCGLMKEEGEANLRKP
jgi:hypothetical protein